MAPAPIAESDRLRLLDHVDGGVCVVQDDAFLYANAPLLELLGPSSFADLTAKRVSAVVDAVDFAAWINATPLNERMAQRWLRADGRRVDVDVTVSAIRLSGADARVVHVRDANAAERSKRTEQLATIATLSAGIAHQLNNPLAYVLANLNFLAEELPPFLRECAPSFSATEHELLTDMLGAMADAREGAERIARVVRDLRECSRADDERRDLVDVRSLLDTACSSASAELGTRGRIVKHYESVGLVEGSATRLTQAFSAILRNAVQSIPEGSTTPLEITVHTGVDTDGTVIVSVTDTGCGMGPSARARVFDPFYSRKPIHLSTGLGLTMTLAIIHSAGGTISVESEEKLGSTFRVRLPAAASPARSSVRSSHGGPEPTLRQRVLIVDDELTLLSSLRRALGSEVDVELAYSAEQAIELLARDNRFDVVLCDIMMPDVTGIELFERVSQTHPHLRERFIFMTGGTPTMGTQEFIEGVGLPYLEKPFDMRQLNKLLRRVKATTIQ